jgi:CRP-like cAMP-binding protein
MQMTNVNLTNSQKLCFNLLRAYPWFDEIEDADLAPLAALSCVQHFKAGSEILCEGQVASHCLLVHTGTIQGLRYTIEGHEKIFGQSQSGSLISVLSAFLHEAKHMYTTRAVTDVEGVLLDCHHLRHLCKTNAAFAYRLIQHNAELVRHYTDQIDWLTSSTAEERLAEYVLRVGKPKVSEPVVLPLTHTQIAVKLGMRPETLSRILMKWRQRDYISNKHDVLRILNLAELKQLAKGQVHVPPTPQAAR